MRVSPLLVSAILFLPIMSACQKVSVPRVSSKYGNVTEFARQFTSHYLDSSYQTYSQSQAALKQETSPGLYDALKKSGTVPKTDKDLKQKTNALAKAKQTSTVVIEEVKAGDVNSNNLVEVSVKGKVTGAQARNFNLVYGIGIRKDTEKLAVVTISGK